MKTTRRGFLGVVAAIPLALKINPEKVEQNKKLLKHAYNYSGYPHETLPEGWYSAQVVDVFERASKNDGSPIYGFKLRTEKGTEFDSLFSSKYLHAMVPALTACKLLNTEQVNLEDAIGKQMRVHVEREEYKPGQFFNRVDEYLALER